MYNLKPGLNHGSVEAPELKLSSEDRRFIRNISFLYCFAWKGDKIGLVKIKYFGQMDAGYLLLVSRCLH